VIDVSASQLSQLSYQAGSQPDIISVRVSNGTSWSNWSELAVGNLETVAPGATMEIAGVSAATLGYSGADGMLKLDASTQFSGSIFGFGPTESLDLSDIPFHANSVLSFVPNAENTGGTLSIGGGTHTANIGLLGQYMASSFVSSNDGYGGTLIQDAALAAPAQRIQLAQPHA
jgi:hypothetical protein